ncbi:MAG TPA: iron-containing alcohol dehydrogenase family protein [Acidimicrobiales bacterium]|nr:iron-containing alcohol dehydrogenase family protein [Acidimicrobiales bacterium]
MDDSWTHTGYAQRIHFGVGRLEQLADVVNETGARRVMLVTTEGRASSDTGRRVASLLGRQLVSTFTGVTSHVPTTAVEAAVRQAQADAVDGLVSFGGGSCADLGKAVCFFVEQQAGTPGISHLDRPAVAHVAVPTAYSGAEVTPFFGMTDLATRRKSGAGGPTTAPVAAVYDPLVTLDTPARVSAETGMNALAHGVEATYAIRRTPEAEAVALACVQRVAASAPGVVEDPTDLSARTAMLVGASLGGRALQNASMGVHHGLAQLLGGRTGIAHGLANALMLAHVLRFNAEAVPVEVARIGAALGDPDDPAGACDRLRARLGLPARLSECGVTEEDLDAVARMSQGNVNVGFNPRPVDEEAARRILAEAW